MLHKPLLALYSLTHLAVDFTCAFLLFRLAAGAPDWALALLLYNFCAFAMQMPLGAIADRLNRNGVLAAAGCALTALSALLPVPLPLAIAAGLGNALFHLGGGLDTLNDSTQKATALGIFVSPLALPPLTLLVLAAAILLLCRRTYGSLRSWNAPPELTCAGRSAAIVPLFGVVVLRSYMGMQQSFPWKADWAFLLTLMLVLGKASGGFLSDRLGPRWASAVSLTAAGLLYFACALPLPGLLAVLLFNMTMPITLWAVARLLPGAKGFAFGLLTFALFLGFLPSYLGWPPLLTSPTAYVAVTAISMGLLGLGLIGEGRTC